MPKKEQKKICDCCGGSGQISFFKGVSRFLLSTEECPGCSGTGYQLPDATGGLQNAAPDQSKNKGRHRKKKGGTS